MQNQRSLSLFEGSIKSKYTLHNYKDHVERFLVFTKIKDYDSLSRVDPKEIQVYVEDYVMYLKKNVNPNSVQTMMTGIKHFFIMNKVPLFWELIQKLYPQKVKPSGSKSWETEQIKKMLENTDSKRNKAIIHFLASTGSRSGVFDYDLTMKNLKDVGSDCMAVLIYAGELDEYWSFLTPEATNALNEYFDERVRDGEKLYSDSAIFRTVYGLAIEKAKPVKRNSVTSVIFRIINKANIKRTRVNRNFDIQMEHGFRKRFNTIMKLNSEVNSNIAEKIFGHSVTHKLDNTYFTPNIDDLFKEFKKAIPELTISAELRLEEENQRKQKKINEMESQKDLEIQSLKVRLGNIEKLLEKN